MNETGKRLLTATRRCIGENGVAGTTSRHIAAAAGVNLAAITYHFGSKDRLVAEALLEALETWLSPTLQVLTGGGDPGARTVAAIQTLVAGFAAHRADAPTYLEALVHAPRLEPLHAGLVGLWSRLRSLLAGQMRELQERGELAAWVDPDTMASVLVAVADGLALQATVDPDGPGIEAMAAQFAGLLLAARMEPPTD